MSMSSSNPNLIAAELKSVRDELAECFSHLSDRELSWAPNEGMRTIQGLFVEIMATEMALIAKIRGGPAKPFEEIENSLWNLQSVESLIAMLEEIRSETLWLLNHCDLSTSVEFSSGMRAIFCLNEVPSSEVFRYIARHEAYHTGQLFSYLWTKGDNPYLWTD